jgi:hypothetical protein
MSFIVSTSISIATSVFIPDAHITLASFIQEYEQGRAGYVASNFRTSLRTLFCDTDMIIDAAFATSILSFSAPRAPGFNNVQLANGHVVSPYQLAIFMDTIDFSWTLGDYKPFHTGMTFSTV